MTSLITHLSYKVQVRQKGKMRQKNKDKEEFPDESSENNGESVEFLDDEFEEDIDSEKSESQMTIT